MSNDNSMYVNHSIVSIKNKCKITNDKVNEVFKVMMNIYVGNKDQTLKVDTHNLSLLNHQFDCMIDLMTEIHNFAKQIENGVPDNNNTKSDENLVNDNSKQVEQSVHRNEMCIQNEIESSYVFTPGIDKPNIQSDNVKQNENVCSTDLMKEPNEKKLQESCKTKTRLEKKPFGIVEISKLKHNYKYTVVVKRIENVNEFYIQVYEFVTKLKEMNTFYKNPVNNEKLKLKISDNAELKTNIDVYVVVRYKKIWCRAKLLHLYPERLCHLYLIDIHENLHNIHEKDVRLLGEEFNFPLVSQMVSLNTKFSEDKDELFKNIVDTNILYEMICKYELDNIFVVELKETNIDISFNDLIEGSRLNDADVRHILGETEQGIEDPMDYFNDMKEEYESERNDYHINTDDAVQAVTGYIPKDENKYCKHGTKCRFKKCYKIHEDPSSWVSRDVRTMHISTPASIEPDVYQNTRVQICYVVDVGIFYAQIILDEDDIETIDSLTEYMKECGKTTNRDERLKKIEGISLSDGELVIVVLCKHYFRGLVRDEVEENVFSIFFVDFGFTYNVHIKDLRQMENRFSVLPFQAIKFTINKDIDLNLFKLKQDQVKYKMCFKLFKNLISGKTFDCIIPKEQGAETKNMANIILFDKNGRKLNEYFSICCKRFLDLSYFDGDITYTPNSVYMPG